MNPVYSTVDVQDVQRSRLPVVLIEDMVGPWMLRQAMLALELHTDVTELFSWNTKQAFLWISVDYVNSRNVRNDVRTPQPAAEPLISPFLAAHANGIMQISIWDHIIMAGEAKKIDYNLLRSKYKVVDQVCKPAAWPSYQHSMQRAQCAESQGIRD